ncbi:MAG: T9SS type A sorting domain-containing protein [Saprospiraceae bacterium]|nr:T9SS type A sorting domain-containing protein [Saprospiraceae bacterium]
MTNYTYFSDYLSLPNGDSIEILNYVFPENQTSAETQLNNTLEIMDLYNSLFGLYPFANEKYGHAQFGWGGGMEHQTMSFVGSFSYGLIAHGLAHQWFGDKVTCASWQDIWLNEGFATYLSGLTSEFRGSEQEWRNWKLSKIANIVSQPGGSVWVSDTNSVSRIFDGRLSYNKGAYLLHMLRWKLGDNSFFAGVRSYLNDDLLAYNYANTTDLRRHLEQASGQDLTEFFADWYYGQGYPSYQLSWNQEEHQLHINLKQSTSHASVDFFEMPVPVYVQGGGRDTLLVLESQFRDQDFDVDLSFEVELVQFDPDLWLISAGNTVEKALVNALEEATFLDLQISPNPVTDQLLIEIREQNVRIDRIEVSDLDGTHLQTYHIMANSVNLDISNWMAGFYQLNIWSGHRFISKKIIKQ